MSSSRVGIAGSQSEAVVRDSAAAPGSAAASPSMRMFGGRIGAIDGLRAIAVLSVLFYHAGLSVAGGLAGVDIFFVISGYVVSRSILADASGGAGGRLARFYARRLLRITPALVAMLIVTTLAYCLFVPSAWLSDAVWRTGLASFAGVSNVMLSANGDAYFSPVATLNPFTHTWSLGVEEQFYLLLPAILLLTGAHRSGRPAVRAALAVAGLAALSIAACAILSRDAPRVAFYSIATRFWELGLGVLLCLTEPVWRPMISRLSATAGTVAALLSAGAMLFVLWSEPGPRFPFPMALVSDLGTVALIMLAVAQPRALVMRALGSAPFAAVGLASYSIYLWHWPVIVLMRWTIGLDDAAHRLAAVAGALILGFLSYRFVEAQAHRPGAPASAHPGRGIGRQLALLAIGALLSEGLFVAKDAISLSRTADRSSWYPGTGSRHEGPPAVHPVTLERTKVDGGIVRNFVPANPAPTRMFMIGDSHSLPYLPALRRLAEETGIGTRGYFMPDCSFIPLSRPMREIEGCRLAFYRRALGEIATTGRTGDVLFLPNLRLPRYVNQWGPVKVDTATAEARAAATSEAIALLRPIAARGVVILFESPTPVFKAPPFRCSDWFNRMNPICAPGLDIARSELDGLRAAPLDQMRLIAGRLPNVRIWDAFGLLCPGRRCSAFRDDQPLFFDGDHLSGYGQAFLYPSLRQAIEHGSMGPDGAPGR